MITTADGLTVELFRTSGCWRKPEGTVLVDVILLGGTGRSVIAPPAIASADGAPVAGGHGGTSGTRISYPESFRAGELVVRSFYAVELPPEVEVRVADGGLAAIISRDGQASARGASLAPEDVSAPDVATVAAGGLLAEVAALRHDLNRALAALHLRSSRP